MNKEKQIEEMAKLMCESTRRCYELCGDCYGEKDNFYGCKGLAESFYDAGYRKAEEVRKETARECLKILHNIGGCDATEEWSKGFDAAIDEAYKEIADKYGVTAFEEDEE